MTAVLRIATCCLAEDLRPGDVLVDAALGGMWDAEVQSVRVYPELVDVELYGHLQRVPLSRHEVCSVLRVAGREIRQAG